jgi:uncharacterized protein YndB with AHSA1/START domain
MGPVRAEIDIDVPRERVFEVIADLGRRPAFTDHFISDYRLLGLRSTGVGAGARFRFFAPPQAVWMDSTIEELDSPHRIVERGRGGRVNRVPSTTVWELEAGRGPFTRVRVIYWTEPANHLDRLKEAAGFASHWYEGDWAVALRRLRDMLESGVAFPQPAGVGGADMHAAPPARTEPAAHQ